MLKLTVLASKILTVMHNFFLIKLRTKLTCRTDYDYVKISETREERQNKRGQKAVVKTGKIVLTHACDRLIIVSHHIVFGIELSNAKEHACNLMVHCLELK